MVVEGLNQYYGGSHILRNVGFEVPAGKVTALLGRNGVGKTTLLKTLMGLVPARTGTIRFGNGPDEGQTVRARPRRARLRAAGARDLPAPHGRGEPDDGGAAHPERFRALPDAAHLLGRRGGDLSGGQQQQLAIGRARDAAAASSSTSRPRASSPRSSKRSSAPFARLPPPARWRSCWSSSTTTSRARWLTSTW